MRNKEGLAIPEDVQIREWIRSDEGRLSHQTISAINLYSHYYKQALADLYGSEIVEPLPIYKIQDVESFSNQLQAGNVNLEFVKPDKLEPLKELMPIKDIRHAIYFSEVDRMIRSQPDTFLMHRVETVAEQRRLKSQGLLPAESNMVVGMTFTVKSTGWNMFTIMLPFFGGNALKGTADGLDNRDTHLLLQERESFKFVPPWKNADFYNTVFGPEDE